MGSVSDREFHNALIYIQILNLGRTQAGHTTVQSSYYATAKHS